MKTLRGLAILLALAAASGCSTLKFGYNRLDWLASWEMAHFVDLDREQKQQFDERFAALWRWHRGTQLSLYARDLRALADASREPFAPEQVTQLLQAAQGHVDRIVDEAMPDTVRVLQGFTDKQVKDLLAEMSERRAKRFKEGSGLDGEERRELAEQRTVKGFKRWIGSLTGAQTRRVHEWSGQRIDSDALWQEYEDAWAVAFSEVLANRHQAEFHARLAALFDEPALPQKQRIDEVEKHNRAAWVALVADLSASLEPRQREHLREALLDLASDFEDLAAKPV